MSSTRRHIRKVAVLGAGVMGAQLAAHLANARIPSVLFDLPKEGGRPSALAEDAIKRMAKMKPAPFGTKGLDQHIKPANYQDDLDELDDCDLVVEAIAERMDWKKDLYDKVAPHLSAKAIFATNTSGLSINELASVLPEAVRDRFCGVHFFNPPRYMHLAEVIPGDATDENVLVDLEAFLTTTLGKGVVRAKDTPNFIGNRIGVFSMLATMEHTQAYGLDFDLVDQLTGTKIGRPKSATYRTADVVGLDTMGHVIQTMADTLPEDPWHRYFGMPDWLKGLVDAGSLGQKTGAGFYRKAGKTIEVLDRDASGYHESGKKPSAEVAQILKISDPAEKFAKLRASDSPEAQFLWACFRDLFHYCAYHLADIADTARDVDLAIRWGYGYQQGPFETWQAAGWNQVAGWIEEEIAAGKTMVDAPLPAWVKQVDGVHSAEGSYSPTDDAFKPRADLAVYERQPFPDPVLGEKFDWGETLFENDGARVWTHGDGIVVVTFKSKMHTVGRPVLEALDKAIDIAEAGYDGLVVWQDSEPFSVGADLQGIGEELAQQGMGAIDGIIRAFQDANVRLARCSVPTVAAVRGMALGGGCEILLHCDRVVAAHESYIGLVEVGVGLLPAGGGLAELARRASVEAATTGAQPFDGVRRAFETVAMGKVATSALEARAFGFLRPEDIVIMHNHELLYVARATARWLADTGYQPPLPDAITVAGDTGVANLKAAMVNMLEGHFISKHDMNIGSRIAEILSGGMIERGAAVNREWLLDMERKHFIELLGTKETQERIQHMLKTGKPLRN